MKSKRRTKRRYNKKKKKKTLKRAGSLVIITNTRVIKRFNKSTANWEKVDN